MPSARFTSDGLEHNSGLSMYRNDWHAAKAGLPNLAAVTHLRPAEAERHRHKRAGRDGNLVARCCCDPSSFCPVCHRNDRSCESRNTSDGMNCNPTEACCYLASVTASSRRMVAPSLPSEPPHFNLGDSCIESDDGSFPYLLVLPSGNFAGLKDSCPSWLVRRGKCSSGLPAAELLINGMLIAFLAYHGRR